MQNIDDKKDKYLCEVCCDFKNKVEYYPFAEKFICDECYQKMMEIGELVNEEIGELAEGN